SRARRAGAGRARRRTGRRCLCPHGGSGRLEDPGGRRPGRTGGGAGRRGGRLARAGGRAFDRRSTRRHAVRCVARWVDRVARAARGLDRRARGGRRERRRRGAAQGQGRTGRGDAMKRRAIVAVVVVLGWAAAWAAWPTVATGQQVPRSLRIRAGAKDDRGGPASPRALLPGGWRPLAIAKWGMLGATAVAAVYGLSASIEADGLYDRISQICASDAGRCAELPEGGY